ncbi:N-acylethanolamine-hydrolyzing acid amidase-like [Scleropages formosus]|uniref:N-acylethanolamine-hydrolyzing acid amidase n=1 Tax=Scleropages formosus TaxID=113540 RepID=A0A8C9QZ40_SCLFO|nr:N-acylethanolamine-hydrolyzing acid amidase [Scleropages formosus]
MRLALALLLLLQPLALAARCSADFTPPLVNVSLDDPPGQRWAPLVKVFDVEMLMRTATRVIDLLIPAWVHRAVAPVAEALEDYIPQPYAGEILGMASFFGSNISDIVLLNFAYEITAFCTSVVAQDSSGRLFHGRNLDYPAAELLRNVTVDVLFLRKGEVAYRGTTFAGYVGLWTGQSAQKFTVSANKRAKGYWWENLISAVLLKSSPDSWLIRETLAEAKDFQDAVKRLSTVPIICDVYYIVAGVRPGEGVVVTRDRLGSADIWPLNPARGEWFRVETNYDHWTPPPHSDDRRTPTMKALNATGQEHINLETLYKVLSAAPTCNGITIYTTTMSAAYPEKYRTVVRRKCSV